MGKEATVDYNRLAEKLHEAKQGIFPRYELAEMPHLFCHLTMLCFYVPAMKQVFYPTPSLLWPRSSCTCGQSVNALDVIYHWCHLSLMSFIIDVIYHWCYLHSPCVCVISRFYWFILSATSLSLPLPIPPLPITPPPNPSPCNMQ